MPERAPNLLRTGALVLSLQPLAAQAASPDQALGGGLFGLAATLLLLALAHRWERRLFLVAGACLSWGALLLLPLPQQHALSLPLLTLLSLFLLALMLRLAGWRRRLHAALLMAPPLGLLLAAQLPGLAAPLQALLPRVLGLGLLAVACAFLWQRWRVWLRQGLQNGQQWFDQTLHTVLPLLLSTATGGLLMHWGRQAEQPLPVAIGLLLGLLAAGMVLAFAQRRVHTEQRLRQAEMQMHERLAEMERHHQQLSDQRLEQVTERERKRIAGDLHDDLGAKLLTIVHTSDNERISTLAREALEEMRLSVRGLTGRPVQLLDAIGDWRAEVVSRLTQSNIEAEWISLSEEVAHTLSARAYVQTTRVIREAVSNVIKHSGATRCTVRCALNEGDFQLVIQDNGRGIPTEKDGRLDRGHGMASMKGRAKQMQGQCLVESAAGWGTLIRLSIPL